jgi:hypothetical protein
LSAGTAAELEVCCACASALAPNCAAATAMAAVDTKWRRLISCGMLLTP